MFIARIRELMVEKVRIHAFFEDDLEVIAKKLGLYEALARGELRCFVCGRRVTLENLGAFLKTGKGAKVVCDNITCIYKAIRISEELKQGR